MADAVDLANERMEQDLARAVQAARIGGGLQAAPSGACLNCFAPLEPTHRWCDPDCLEDWQHRKARS